MAQELPELGADCLLLVGDGTSGAYVQFAYTIAFSLPKDEASQIAYPHLGMGTTIPYRSGLEEPGDFSFEVDFTPTDYARLRALRNVEKNYKLIFPDTATEVWAGKITSLETTGTPEALLTIKCAGKVYGDSTYTPAA